MSETVTIFRESGDDSFQADLWLPQDAEEALVLVHGFGVRRDSRGMFPDIAEQHPDKIVYAPDLSSPTDEGADALPFSKQMERVQDVVRMAQAEGVEPDRITLIGHSMGAILVAQLVGEYGKRILLAPPTGEAYEQFIETDGWKREGSELNVDGTSTLLRSDGSKTLVGSDFWDEFRALGDVDRLYEDAAERTDTVMVFAGADNVFGEPTPVDGVRSITIDGANHDFSDEARAKLLAVLATEIR